MSAYPQTIYLFPMEDQTVWDADNSSPEAEGAQKYVRADTLPQPVLPPRPPTGAGMPRYGLQQNGPAPMDDGHWTSWHLANSEVERLQARVSELESQLKSQGNAAKMGMDAATKDAIWREENAKRLLAESNPAAIESERKMNAELTEEIGHLEDSLISQGQMLREIVNITKGPPDANSWHSTHDAVESVERLKAISDNAIRAMENL